MSTLKFASAAALCGLLTGCGAGAATNHYLPIAGMTQTQTANSAYWGCVGQNWQREATQDPNFWVIPVGVVPGIAQAAAEAPGRQAYVHNCMVQKGWLIRPGLENTDF